MNATPERICTNLTSVLRKDGVKFKCKDEEVSKNVFSIDIPIEDVNHDTVEKLIRVAQKYKIYKTHTSLKTKLRLIFDTAINENLNHLISFKMFEAKASMQHEKDVEGEKITLPLVDKDFEVLVKKGKNTVYYFIEKYPKKKTSPWVYMYTLESGNITRGNESLWARQEIRSTSKAFHKDNENRKAIPEDLTAASRVILLNYLKTRYKDEPHLLNDKIREVNRITGVFDED